MQHLHTGWFIGRGLLDVMEESHYHYDLDPYSNRCAPSDSSQNGQLVKLSTSILLYISVLSAVSDTGSWQLGWANDAGHACGVVSISAFICRLLYVNIQLSLRAQLEQVVCVVIYTQWRLWTITLFKLKNFPRPLFFVLPNYKLICGPIYITLWPSLVSEES